MDNASDKSGALGGRSADNKTILKRSWTIQISAIISAVLALISIGLLIANIKFNPDDKIPASAIPLCASGGFLFAGLILNLLWGVTSNARMSIYWFSLIAGSFIPLLIMLILTSALSLPDDSFILNLLVAVSIAAAGIMVVFYERGLSIEIDSKGIKWIREMPSLKTVSIPWDSVEAIKTDFRVITTQTYGSTTVEDEQRVEITGSEGGKIAFESTRYANSLNLIQDIVTKSLAVAKEKSLQKVKSEGRISLGPVALTKDSIALNRNIASSGMSETNPLVIILLGLMTAGAGWIIYGIYKLIIHLKGPINLAYSDIKNISLEAGYVKIEGPKKTWFLPVRRVPNALILAELVAAIKQN